MHLKREIRAALVAAVVLAGVPALTLVTETGATAKPDRAGGCTILGTGGDDVLVGTGGDDVICGFRGDDRLVGRGGDDVLRGGLGDDVLRGGPGDDFLSGAGGDDRVLGQAGDDVVRGDRGDDEVVGGPGDDRLSGFRGIDVVRGEGDPGGFVDRVRCGPGPDEVSADPADVVAGDCETVLQNDPPTGLSLTPSSVAENAPAGTLIGVLSVADPDPGDSHTFVLVAGAGSGDNALVQVEGNRLETAGVLDHESDASLSVRVRATDGAGESTEQAMTVAVTDANDAPTAVDDDAAGTEDTQVDLPVSGAGSPASNDTDPDGGSLSVSAVSGASGGTVSISGGLVEFDPTENLCGTDAASFTYTVSDGQGGTDTGTVTLDLTCVEDAPDAVADDRTVAEDSTATALGVLTNDTDPESDPITITSFTDPAAGTVQLVGPAGAGTNLTYEPDANFCNDPPPFDTFTYTVDGGDTATVRMTVTCVNDAPSAVDDDRTTVEDTPLSDPVSGAGSPAANDSDVDAGDTLTVTAVSDPTGGTVAIVSGDITFTPTADLCGNDAAGYDYTVSDGNGGTDTGAVTIDLTCENDAPVAVDDDRTVAEDSGTNTFATVLGNDTDAESDPITITDASDPAHGATTFTAADVTYTPDADYCGTDSFTYTVNGGDTATVSVSVTCVDDAPVANDDSRTVAEDSGATTFTGLLGNDTDVESDPISITGASDPAHGSTSSTAADVTYTPDGDYCGADSFTYTVNGGDTATVTVTVSCVDDDPTADDDSATVTLNDPATPVDVLGNDDNADGGPVGVASASDPAHGTVVLTGGSPGDHTGLTYEPDTGYCNTDPVGPADTFTYTLTPGGDTATVSVTVTCDVPPVAVDDTATVAEDAPAGAVDVLANDPNPDGGPKVVTAVSDPGDGTATFTAAEVSYAPDANFCGSDSFTYTVNGGDTATVAVTVTCVDDAPVANDDSRDVDEDSGATTFGTLLANDTDVESDPISITGASDPAHGSTSFTAADVTYTPDADYCGDDSFTYTVNGGDTATVTVTVACVPDPPTLTSSAGTTTYTEDAAPVVLDGNVTISNPDGLAITAGSVTLGDDVAGDVLDWTDNDLGDGITEGTSTALELDLSGTGTAAEWEAALEAVTFATPSQDPSSADRTATFSVTTSAGAASDTKLVDASNVDDLPTADADSATLLEDAGATTVPVLANDDDVDAGPMTISSVTDPANGTTAITGGGTGLTYAPDANYCNDPGAAPEDTFTYTLNSGGAPQTATVSMTVTCVNDAPVADDETFDGAKRAIGNTSLVVDDPTDGAPDPAGVQKTVSGDILDGDTDVDTPLANLTVLAETKATTGGGSVTIQADGDFTYLGEQGCADTTDSFAYTVQDNDPTDPRTGSGTVNLTQADCVWYVDGSVASQPAAATGGTSQTPFKTLADIDGAGGAGDEDGTSDRIFLFGNSTYAGPLPLEASQQVTSARHGLSVPDGGAGTTVLVAAGSSGGNPTISGVVLGAGNVLQGITFGASSGYSLSGTSIGTATINTVTDGALFNAVGGAIQIDGTGNTLNAAFTTMTAAGGTNANSVGLTNVNGSIQAGSGTLSGSTSSAVSITGGSADVTLGANITSANSAPLVSITGTTGGTKDFNGSLTSNSSGISLTNNSGATTRFDGGVTLSTGANPAFTATGGGTVVVTGSANTLVTTTAAALTVTSTNIGANGLTFRSVSANGGSKAIVLNATGSAGGLTVTGTGAAGTGGTIQNTSTRGAELVNTAGVSLSNMNFVSANNSVDGGGAGACDDLTIAACNAAIYLNGVTGITLDRVNLSGTMVENGITGVGVSGLTLSNSSITGAGNEAHESGMELQNLSGTSTVSNTDISFSETNSVDIVNTDVSATLTFDNVSLRDTQTVSSGGATNGNGEGGVQFRSFSSAAGQPTTNLDIVNSDLLRLRTQAVQAIAEDDSILNVDITGNTIDSQADIGAGIDLNGNDTAQVRFNVLNNPTINTRGGAAVNVTAFVDAAITGRINGNTIQVNGSGAGGSGLRVLPQESSTGVVEARNNSIVMGAGNNSAPIDAQARFTDARLDLTLDGNTTDTDPLALADINVTAGSSAAGETNVVCLDLKNHTAVPPVPSSLRSLRLRVSDVSNTIRMYLEGFNTDSETTWDARGNTPTAGQNVNPSLTGSAVAPAAPPGGTCAEPTNPTP